MPLQIQSAELPLSALELLHTFQKLLLAKLGPGDRSDEELRVGGLPDKKVAPAHFARCANQEVWIGHLGAVEMLSQ